MTISPRRSAHEERQRSAPVLSGCVFKRQVSLRGLVVAETRFPAGLYLPSHYHETACLTIMLAGGLRERLPHRTLDCVPGWVLAKPWEERHDDLFSREGSHQIVIEVPQEAANDLPEALSLFAGTSVAPDNGSRGIAARMTRELARPDGASRLVLESCALELLALLLPERHGTDRRVPAWLSAARDRLRDELWSDHSTQALASAAGVNPGYFARLFRRHFGRSVGSYLRDARLDWTATQLRTTRRPLSELAHAARFADHSHFTREFRRRFGMPPREYRERYT